MKISPIFEPSQLFIGPNTPLKIQFESIKIHHRREVNKLKSNYGNYFLYHLFCFQHPRKTKQTTIPSLGTLCPLEVKLP
ncbi:hypothetical protein AAZX31_08G041500 [Glycine max]